MKKLTFLLLRLIVLCALSSVTHFWTSDCFALEPIIEANFNKCVCADFKNGSWSIEKSKDQLRLVIAGLDTKEPKIKGNLGVSTLIPLPRGNTPVLYFLETTAAGHLNLLTIFPQKKAVTFSKSYPMPNGEPFSMVCTGTYK